MFIHSNSWDETDKIQGVTSDNKVTITEEYFNQLETLIHGICMKKKEYAEKVGLDYDTIHQECWVVAMGVIQGEAANGRLLDNMIKPGWFAQCCFNRIVDLGRYQFRRVNQIPVDPSVFDRSNTNVDDNYSSGDSIWTEARDMFWNTGVKPGSDFDSELNITDIENLFPEGSRERRYVEAMEIYANVKQVDPDVFDSIFTLTASVRNELAWYLGFARSDSSGFRNLERRVRDKIREYLSA